MSSRALWLVLTALVSMAVGNNYYYSSIVSIDGTINAVFDGIVVHVEKTAVAVGLQGDIGLYDGSAGISDLMYTNASGFIYLADENVSRFGEFYVTENALKTDPEIALNISGGQNCDCREEWDAFCNKTVVQRKGMQCITCARACELLLARRIGKSHDARALVAALKYPLVQMFYFTRGRGDSKNLNDWGYAWITPPLPQMSGQRSNLTLVAAEHSGNSYQSLVYPRASKSDISANWSDPVIDPYSGNMMLMVGAPAYTTSGEFICGSYATLYTPYARAYFEEIANDTADGMHMLVVTKKGAVFAGTTIAMKTLFGSEWASGAQNILNVSSKFESMLAVDTAMDSEKIMDNHISFVVDGVKYAGYCQRLKNINLYLVFAVEWSKIYSNDNTARTVALAVSLPAAVIVCAFACGTCALYLHMSSKLRDMEDSMVLSQNNAFATNRAIDAVKFLRNLLESPTGKKLSKNDKEMISKMIRWIQSGGLYRGDENIMDVIGGLGIGTTDMNQTFLKEMFVGGGHHNIDPITGAGISGASTASSSDTDASDDERASSSAMVATFRRGSMQQPQQPKLEAFSGGHGNDSDGSILLYALQPELARITNAQANKQDTCQLQSATIALQDAPPALQVKLRSTSPSGDGCVATEHLLGDWRFDPESTGLSKPLSSVAVCSLDDLGVFGSLGLKRDDAYTFFRRLEDNYGSRARFHSAAHAASTVAAVFCMLQRTKNIKFTSEEMLSVILAAAAVNYKHSGVDNNFLCSTFDDVALCYHMVSPNQNIHCSEMFKVLFSMSMPFIRSRMPADSIEKLQVLVSRLILSTDTANLVSLLSKCEMRKPARGAQPERISADDDSEEAVETRATVLELMLNLACYACTAKSRNHCSRWGRLLMDEFYNQGDMERAAKLQITAYKNRDERDEGGCLAVIIDHVAMTLANYASAYVTTVDTEIKSSLDLNSRMCQDMKAAKQDFPAINRRGSTLIVANNVVSARSSSTAR